MAKQAVLSRVVRQDVSDNVVRVAADGGLDERLLRYLDVVDDNEAVQLLNALEGASDSRRLTQVVLREDAPASFQRQLARQFSEGDIDTDDVRTALRRIDETSDPAVRDSLYRTVSEGGSNGARLLARTDNLDAVKRLVSDPEVGDDARTLIREFDDPDTLEAFFELDVSRADGVWRQLAQFSTDKQFSVGRAEQFVKDTQVVKNVPGFDTPASAGGRSTIDDILSAGDAGNLKGDQLEVRVAADRINQGQKVDAIGRDIDTTDVDIELNNEIVEAKNKITEDGALDKLDSFENAAKAGDLQLDDKAITFDSPNDLSDSAKENIRREARQIEARNNGIDNIQIRFDSTPSIVVNSQ